jgi:hypothetical protein
MTTTACKAKNPATCRFHGTAILPPMKSDKAFSELKTATGRLAASSGAKNLEAHLKLDEAKVNFDITKRGIEHLQARVEEGTADYDTKLRYEAAKSIRAGILEEYAEHLVSREFSDNPQVQRVANLAMLSNFAKFEEEGLLDEELRSVGVGRKAFFTILQQPSFGHLIEKIENKYLSAATEVPAHKVVNEHSALRKQVTDQGLPEESLDAAIEANMASVLV